MSHGLVQNQETAEAAPASVNETGLPLVAIVTPVYNGGKYLEKTMASVQAQTYPNIVHVLLNNASVDNSADVIASFKNTRIPIQAHTNEAVLPLAANWRKAFSFVPTDAKYAKLLCADDLVRPDCIEKFVRLAESDPEIQVVLCQDVYDDLVRRARLPADTQIHDGKTFVRHLMEGSTGWLAYHHFFIRMHPDYRDGKLIEDYWSPDPHAVVRGALRGKLGYIHEPLLYNRHHNDSVTGKELKKRGIQRELVEMHLLHNFGRASLQGETDIDKKYKRLIDRFLGQMCRHTVRWRMSGEKERANDMLAVLKQNGYSFSHWDYVRYLAVWPINSVVWRILETRAGPHIDELTFMAMAHL